jgi:hypothetical protein
MDDTKLWEQFHSMWNDAKAQRNYDKTSWLALQAMLNRLETRRNCVKLPDKATLEPQWVPSVGAVRYRTLFIEPKRDFGSSGCLIDGKIVAEGWVVTDGNCNVMPCATWFQTVESARSAIDVLIGVRGDVQMFWEIVQPFRHTPGDKSSLAAYATSGGTTCGRHYANYTDGVCTEVGIAKV